MIIMQTNNTERKSKEKKNKPQSIIFKISLMLYYILEILMLGVCKIALLLSALSYYQLFLLSSLHLAVMCQGMVIYPCSSISQLTDVALFPARVHKEMLSHPGFPQILQQACWKDCLCMSSFSILSTSDSISRRNQKEEG